MVFFGITVKAGASVPVTGDPMDLLHVSQACIANPKAGQRSYLKVKRGSETFTMASIGLENPTAALDMFLSTTEDVQLLNTGNADVHVTGYFEPTMMDDD